MIPLILKEKIVIHQKRALQMRSADKIKDRGIPDLARINDHSAYGDNAVSIHSPKKGFLVIECIVMGFGNISKK